MLQKKYKRTFKLVISDHLCRILIMRGFGSGKTNSLLNLTNHQSDIDKSNLYAKDPHR